MSSGGGPGFGVCHGFRRGFLSPAGRPTSWSCCCRGWARRSATILLVETDPRLARLVAGVLREADGEFRVEHVARLSRALTRLARPGVDLVLADPDLPDSTGATTVRILRRAMPEIPLIVVSAADDVGAALEAVRAGADEYVVKS